MPDRKILRTLADNPALLKATMEIIEEQFKEDEISYGMTDEQIGQITRAKITGLKKVANAFRKIEQFKEEKEVKKEENPAY